MPIEDAFAPTKAIVNTNFLLHLQLQKLICLRLLEMMSDPLLEPRVRCLATDQDVVALAGVCDIKLEERLAESLQMGRTSLVMYEPDLVR